MPLDLDTIRAAHARIRPHIHRTPVLTSASLDAACGGALFFKCENFQKVGAFKVGKSARLETVTDLTPAMNCKRRRSANPAPMRLFMVRCIS